MLILALAFLMPSNVYAYVGVTIVMSTPSETNLDFVRNFKDELITSDNTNLKVTVIDLSEVEKLVVAENSELVIALGVKALTASSKLKHTTPILGVFTPLPVFNKLLAKSRRSLGIFSAIVLDQPYRRQVALVKAILPNAKRLGILLGDTSMRYEAYLRDGGKANALLIDIENIHSDIELIPKLKKIFESNDALLAIPDPVVYNRESAQPILLTSYRYQKPVFGYSRSYVRAGALAAVYSNAKHLARQAAEIAAETQKASGLLPPPRAPKYFSVKVNRQVAKSLSLPKISEDAIYKKLLLLETVSLAPVQQRTAKQIEVRQ